MVRTVVVPCSDGLSAPGWFWHDAKRHGGANGHYGYLFEEPVDEISGDILIDFENLPPEMKQTILLLVKNAADRDAAQ